MFVMSCEPPEPTSLERTLAPHVELELGDANKAVHVKLVSLMKRRTAVSVSPPPPAGGQPHMHNAMTEIVSVGGFAKSQFLGDANMVATPSLGKCLTRIFHRFS